jgi:hypothetical protein
MKREVNVGGWKGPSIWRDVRDGKAGAHGERGVGAGAEERNVRVSEVSDDVDDSRREMKRWILELEPWSSRLRRLGKDIIFFSDMLASPSSYTKPR